MSHIMFYSRLRNTITREKLRLFVRFATYKQESSDKYPFLVKVIPRGLGAPSPFVLGVDLPMSV